MQRRKKSPSESSRVIVVLGSHRSGTSALTASLPLLGVDIGSTIEHVLPRIDSPETNVKGFFELRQVVIYHEQLLNSMNMKYYSAAAFPDNWLDFPDVGTIIAAMRSFVERRFGPVSLWGFKDPRTCRFLSIWQSIFRDADIEDSYILVARNPLDVALSLQRRDHLPLERGLLLWLNHMVPAVRDTANKPRVVIDYDAFLDDPEGVLKQLCLDLSLEWPANPLPVARFCQEFLDPTMRHYHSPELESTDVPHDVFQAYESLCQASRGEISSDTLTQRFLDLDIAPMALVVPYLRQLENPKSESDVSASISDPETFCQIFFSTTNSNFREETSEKIFLRSELDHVHDCDVTVIVRGKFTAFRLDPLNTPGIISDLKVAVAVEVGGRYTDLPLDDVKHLGVIGDHEGRWIAIGQDSQYHFCNIQLEPGDILRIRFQYQLVSQEGLIEAIVASRNSHAEVEATKEGHSHDGGSAAVLETLRNQVSKLKQNLQELAISANVTKQQLERENTNLLDSLSRVTAEKRKTEIRLLKDLARLTEDKGQLESQLEQERTKSYRISSQDSDRLRELESGVEHLQRELDNIRKSKAYKFVLKFRQRLDRFAPEGSWRRRFYMSTVHKNSVVSALPPLATPSFPEALPETSIFEIPIHNGRIQLPQIRLTTTNSVRVVIPVYKPDQEFEQTLEMIAKQQDVKVSPIIIDSGRSAPVEALVKKIGGEYLGIDKEDFRHGATRNLGLEDYAVNKYHFFTVQDAILVDYFCLARMVDFMETHASEHVVACSGRTIPRSDADLFACWQIFSHYHYLNLQASTLIEATAQPLQKRLFYDNVVGLIASEPLTRLRFSNDRSYGEDVDLAQRLVADGGTLGFVKEAVAIHSHVRPARYYFRRGILEGLTSAEYFGETPRELSLEDWIEFASVTNEKHPWLNDIAREIAETLGKGSDRLHRIEVELAQIRRSIKEFARPWDPDPDILDVAIEKGICAHLGTVLGLLAATIPAIQDHVRPWTKGV